MTYRQWPSAADRANPTGGGVVVFPSPPGALTLTGLAPTVAVGGYSTTFPATENPISEGGIWTNGSTVGLDWQNVRTNAGSPGIAYGVGASAGYDDCIAALQGRFSTTKHFTRITISKAAGYTPPSTHECEGYVALTIAAHSAKGYELDFGFGLPVQPVRWNGALGDFDTGVFTTVSGSPFSLADGETADTLFDSSSGSPVISMWKNNTARSGPADYVFTDTTAGKILSGSPGMGFFARAGTGLDMTKYCIKGFAAGSA